MAPIAMSAKLDFGRWSRRRLYAARRLQVVGGQLARGPLLGVYQATFAEAAIGAARRDFPSCAAEVLAALDGVAHVISAGKMTCTLRPNPK